MITGDTGSKVYPYRRGEEVVSRNCPSRHLVRDVLRGPVFVNNESDTVEYQTHAIMESDVHEEGNAPKNMTNGKPFSRPTGTGKGGCLAR